jgi:hypothetical protein
MSITTLTFNIMIVKLTILKFIGHLKQNQKLLLTKKYHTYTYITHKLLNVYLKRQLQRI